MQLAFVILTLPWTVTGAVLASAAGASLVSRRARRVIDREVWGR